jgi:hypothetical protein
MVKNYSFNKKKTTKMHSKKKEKEKPCINIIFRREFKDIRNKEEKKQATKETKIRKSKSTQHFST